MRASGVEKTIEIDGHRLTYWDQGRGPELLLLHGMGGSNYDWRHLFRELASAGFRVLALEMLGAGYSDKPGGADYSMEAAARRASAFLHATRIPKATIVGFGFGGGVALRLALTHRAQVHKLVILDAPSLPQEWTYPMDVMRTPVLSDLIALLPTRLLVRIGIGRNYFDRSKLREEEIDEYAHEAGFAGSIRSTLAMARTFQIGEMLEFSSRCTSIEVPTLILWGDEDRLVPVRNAHWLREEIRGARLLLFPQCGSAPQMEWPAETARAIVQFAR